MTAAVLGPSKPFNIVVTHLHPDLVGRSTGRHDKYIVLPKAQHLMKYRDCTGHIRSAGFHGVDSFYFAGSISLTSGIAGCFDPLGI